MSCPLLVADDHPKIGNPAGANIGEDRFQFRERLSLFAFRQTSGEFELTPVPHSGNTSGRHYSAIHHSRFPRLGTYRIGVVIIALRLLHEMKQRFMHIPKAVLRIVHAALDLVPDHAVPEYPSLMVNQLEG